MSATFNPELLAQEFKAPSKEYMKNVKRLYNLSDIQNLFNELTLDQQAFHKYIMDMNMTMSVAEIGASGNQISDIDTQLFFDKESNTINFVAFFNLNFN